MAQRHGTSWLYTMALLTAAFTIGPNPVWASTEVDDGDGEAQRYKGSETLDVVSAGPNPARCGAAPNIEVVFEGSGIDTAGGIFTVVSSACQNVATGEVFDLVATDTYASGDSITIESDPFFLVFDPQTCVSSNVDPVRYRIAGGTGAFAGAKGGGRFDIASNDPNCNGELAPAFVWFRGRIR